MPRLRRDFSQNQHKFVFIDNDVVLPVEIPTVRRCPGLYVLTGDNFRLMKLAGVMSSTGLKHFHLVNLYFKDVLR